jgi:RND family efflux transporter MFP subunit
MAKVQQVCAKSSTINNGNLIFRKMRPIIRKANKAIIFLWAKNKRNFALLFSCLISLVALGAFLVQSGRRVSAQCLLIQARTMQETAYLTGLVNPRLSVNLTAEKTGKVSRLLVKEGDSVQKGQVVALLDSKDVDLQIRNKSHELAAIIKKAAKLEERAKRILSLEGKGVLPVIEIQETQASIFDTRAELARVRGEMVVLQRDRANNFIVSPFAGVVAQIFAFPGTFVSPMTSASDSDQSTKSTILQIYSDLQVVINSPEASIFDVLNAASIVVTPTTDRRVVVPARVDRVMPYVILTSSKVSAIPIRLQLADQRPFLPGMNVDVQAVKPAITGLSVREFAIVKKDGVPGVYLCSKKEPLFEPLTILGRGDGFALVRATKRLQPGSKYMIVDPEMKSADGFMSFFKGQDLDRLKDKLDVNPLK